MPNGPDSVLAMKPGEEDAVDVLLQAAFPGPQQTGLVRRLRADGDLADELVLRAESRIIGYYTLCRLGAPKGWPCLAPVAVHRDWQEKGEVR